MRRPGVAARAPRRAREVALGVGEGLAAHALEERPLDQAVSHLAREVVHRRVAALRGRDQAVEERREIRDRRRATPASPSRKRSSSSDTGAASCSSRWCALQIR